MLGTPPVECAAAGTSACRYCLLSMLNRLHVEAVGGKCRCDQASLSEGVCPGQCYATAGLCFLNRYIMQGFRQTLGVSGCEWKFHRNLSSVEKRTRGGGTTSSPAPLHRTSDRPFERRWSRRTYIIDFFKISFLPFLLISQHARNNLSYFV